MEYYIGKLLQPLISPYHLGMISLILTWLTLRRGRLRTAKFFLTVAILLMLVPGIPYVANLPFEHLERVYKSAEVESQPQVDAIVVLGGTAVRKSYPRVDAEEMGGARLLQGARLFRAQKAKYVVVSGGNPYRSPAGEIRTESDDMADVLVDMGVPKSAILRENQSRNTVENASETAKLLKEKNLRSILLVTSAYHMPRAFPLFEAQGLAVTAVPCSYLVTDGDAEVGHFVPSADALHRSSLAMKELVGALFNRFTRKS